MDKIQILKNTRLGKYFTAFEFCNTKDNHAIIAPDPTLFQKLDQLREIVGSINITSGYRTPKFNQSVGGSANSNHTKGLAADIKFDFKPWSIENVQSLCVGIGFNNIGIYLNKDKSIAWVHVDIWARWSQANGWLHVGNSSVKIYNI